MAWAIDRLGRSLIDLLRTIQDLEAVVVSRTPAGHFQMGALPMERLRLSTTLPLKEPPSLPVRVTPGGRLDLAPVAALTRSVDRIAALAHYPLQAPRLGRAQQCQAILEGFGKRDSWAAETLQQGLQTYLALHERLRTKIRAIERK